MPLLFHESPKYLLTSESVTEGHPDKLCDQISDAVLDAALAGDRMSRVACETVATKNLVMVTGEITSSSNLNFNDIARQVMLDIGYTDVKYGLDGYSCGVVAHVSQQSADISQGVTTALEHRTEGEAADARRATGAGDQGNDGRFRLQRDRKPDAPDSRLVPPAGRTAGRGAQRRHPSLPWTRRQVASNGGIPLWQAPPG